MSQTSKINRIISFDFLRIIAILFVVMIHSTAQTFYSYPIKSIGFLFATLLNSISRPAVPIFVMISGALMLDETKQISNKKIFKKALYLLLILIGWSIFYASISLIINHQSTFSISSFIKAILLGHYHLWFLYMLIGLYLITPILRLFVKKANSKYILYFILLSVLFQFITPTINLISNKIAPTSLHGTSTEFISMFFANFVCGYTPYYLIGWYISNIVVSKKFTLFTYVLGVFCLIFIYIGTIVLSSNTFKYETFLSNLNLPVFVYSVALFLFVFNIFKDKQINQKVVSTVSKLSSLTFGVYLIHELILMLLQNYFFDIRGLHIPLTWAITTIASFLISFIISKIPYLKTIIKS